ncbi:MAG: ABC transporter ATP-binding protein [Planctomycetaceae bacterium]|nr:ABC transporter ATP-binding protein [Planctomycetaceae bacterium]
MTASPPPDEPASPTSSQLLWRLCSLAWRFRGLAGLVLALNVTLVVLNLGSLSFTGLGIDVLRETLVSGATAAQWPGGVQPPTDWSPRAHLVVVAAIVLACSALSAVTKYVTALVSALLSQRMLVQLRAEIYDKLQRLSFRFFDRHDSSGIIGRVAADAQAVRSFIDGVVLKVLTVVLSLAVYMGYMLALHVPLTLACLCTSPLLWIGAVWFSRSVRPLYLRSSELSDRMISALAENVQGIQVVKGFAREPEEIARFAEANRRIKDQKYEIFRRLSTYQPMMGFLTQVNQLILIGYGGYLVIRGELPLGAGMFVFANLMSEFAGQVGQIVNIANTIQSSLTAAERVFEVLDAPLELTDAADAVPLPRAKGHIRFEHVTFGYHPGQPVLHDVTLDIAPGERIGFVGETGAGKTTLLGLVSRFYDPNAGRVLIDGVDVRQYRLNDLRRNIGLVFQESFLFSNTVAANIAFGRPNASLDDITQAAQLSAAHEFIAELPAGYDNLIGEHGSNLSGGQRQRLAIARALLLDPPILMLDDATAAVDPETEHEIRTAIERAMAGRTTLIVSSRVSTLRRTDRICVLKQGRIVELGTHDELIEQRGEYFRLARLQTVEDVLSDDVAPSETTR